MAESSSPTEGRRRGNMEEPELFSHDSSSLLFLFDQLLCPICVDVLTDPVTTPQCWDKNQHCHCPLCNQIFTKRPELKINTTLREVADHFKKKSGSDKPEVLCDACSGEKLKALKSCLDCGLSFCKIHLEPHYHVPTLKKHKLINPVENLEANICKKHERALELFCRDDQKCVCQFCIETDHKNHNTIPIEEERRKNKTQLMETQTEVQQMIQDRLKKIEEIKHSVEQSKRSTEKEKADIVEVFTALIRSIERSQAELLEMMEEKQKAAERQAEGLIKELEQEISVLKRRDTELEQLTHTEDHLHLQQIYSSMCSPPHTKNWTEISTDVGVDTVRTALSQLQQTLNEKLTKLVTDKLKETDEYNDLKKPHGSKRPRERLRSPASEYFTDGEKVQ
ncbi:tripartite motif-containing protein 29-like isoform X2 [Tachysurus fulvidraco]|uniref:tripartite motif-containing protein 29-like isoform X2 n=1 Tax=Tachysurus fulvidraco TaxID=1234273 RepID=UPI001FEF621F|nr:tripartite motif-containing protein 29-like isoform X2 [Tachysurus fulvidraco]